MNYPRVRMRRRRDGEWMRRLVAESSLSADDLIWPLFVHDEKDDAEVDSMPGVFRLGEDGLLRAAENALRARIPAIALFPAIPNAQKTADGCEAWNADGLIPRALSAVKKRFPELGTIADAALDPYTSNGHDGVVDSSGYVLNDETIAALRKQTLTLAAAGADIIAPSDMMDGRIGALRDSLDAAGHSRVKILSYAAKYASAFYGPFRDAARTAALGGTDKNGYQMDFRNRREALEEMRLDLAEGADMLMVKPGLPYLDIVRDAAREFDAPIFAYQVSGEYAMLRAAAANGWIDGGRCILESLSAFKRAGARAILTYFARDAAAMLRD